MFVDGELDDERASEVLAFIAVDADARAIVAGLRLAGTLLASDALSDEYAGAADEIADRVMLAVAPPSATQATVASPATEPTNVRPLRSHARAQWAAVASLALAAAAAWTLWIKGHSAVVVERNKDAAPVVAEQELGSNHATAEVDAVDFGARAGTIFYIPSEGSTTAVVWLTDDDSAASGGSL